MSPADPLRSAVRDGRLGNYGYLLTAHRVALLGQPWKFASTLSRLIRYAPPPAHTVEPPVELTAQYGLTAAEANDRMAQLVEIWIHQQADSDID